MQTIHFHCIVSTAS